jgi:hypothetical protein
VGRPAAGQIEVFTWSASGTIITDMLATSFPTVLIYIVDTPRTVSPTTFMSNMLYACSILYKTRLPIVLTFSKTDVVSHAFAQEWMTDYEKFQEVRAMVGRVLTRGRGPDVLIFFMSRRPWIRMTTSGIWAR